MIWYRDTIEHKIPGDTHTLNSSPSGFSFFRYHRFSKLLPACYYHLQCGAIAFALTSVERLQPSPWKVNILFSGLAVMSVAMTGRRMTGSHRRIGTAS